MTRILVAYATRLGSTAEIAEVIGTVLRTRTHQIDIRPVEDIQSVEEYAAVVVGSAIRGGKWLPSALAFLEKHHTALSALPVAYFTVCMTLADGTQESVEVASSYHELLYRSFPNVSPVSIGMFAGEFDPKHAAPLVRLLARGLGITEGDWRDWQVIGDWARTLLDLLDERLGTA
ncbi:MAG: flavodoxin domain-containing protein [Anaerolineae bacterium]|nr:flavodoxin domain-containing protein [Anaerolineae bacterium]